MQTQFLARDASSSAGLKPCISRRAHVHTRPRKGCFPLSGIERADRWESRPSRVDNGLSGGRRKRKVRSSSAPGTSSSGLSLHPTTTMPHHACTPTAHEPPSGPSSPAATLRIAISSKHVEQSGERESPAQNQQQPGGQPNQYQQVSSSDRMSNNRGIITY